MSLYPSEGSTVRHLVSGEVRKVAYCTPKKEVLEQFDALYKKGLETGSLLDAHTLMCRNTELDVVLWDGGCWEHGTYEVLESTFKPMPFPSTPEQALENMKRLMGEDVEGLSDTEIIIPD
jgi:hypothetical protein